MQEREIQIILFGLEVLFFKAISGISWLFLSAGERDKEVPKFITMAAGYNPVLLDFDDSFEDQSQDVDAPQDDRDFSSDNLLKDETWYGRSTHSFTLPTKALLFFKFKPNYWPKVLAIFESRT